MKRSTLLIFGILFYSLQINAQTDFRPGFIISLKDDTIHGKIDYRGDKLMGQLCKFKKSGTDTAVIYSPFEIKGFRFTNSKYYISKEINREYVYLEYLIKGKVNVFYLRDQNGDHYYMSKDSVALTEIPYGEKIIEENGIQYLKNSNKHYGLLNCFFKEVPELSSEIEKIQTPECSNLINLAKKYHNTICADESCIIYAKPKPLFSALIEINMGKIWYQKDVIDFKNSYQFGAIAHIWLPRSNENLYFRTGIQLSNYRDEHLAHRLNYKIPIQLEYLYPTGKIRPRIAFGANFYTGIANSMSGLSNSINGGINYKINNSFNLMFNYEYESYGKIAIIPGKTIAQNLSIGIQIKI